MVDLLVDERGVMLDLLESLAPEDWERKTECPAWSVKGIALHVLGDDLSLLSRQRDDAPPGVVWESVDGSWEGLMSPLDEFNERWVAAASFFSTPLLIDLLRMSGEATHAWYAAVDRARLGGEAVVWVSPEPAPYWLLAAREYVERWTHQLQIRRSVGRPGLSDDHFVVPAVAVIMRGYPQALASLASPSGTTVTVAIDAASPVAWTLRRDGDRWTLLDGEPEEPSVRLALDVAAAAALFSRGLRRDEAARSVGISGDEQLGTALVAGMAAFFGR